VVKISVASPRCATGVRELGATALEGLDDTRLSREERVQRGLDGNVTSTRS
jgi:hypothetical protein